MCGIVGGFGNISVNEFDVLPDLRHRGPDDSGIFKTQNAFLGHVRLSIQDVSVHGHQPMISDDGRYVLIFNGEIYNHFELRRGLERATIGFRSTSDTETLLYGLIETGSQFIKQLNGIFAFAFFDSKTNELIVARDQFGVKPLYYFSDGGKFMFCSELKGLIDFVDSPTVSENRIRDYLSFLWCPGSGTPVEEIKKVLPGYYVQLSLDSEWNMLERWYRYYQIPFDGVYSRASESALIDLLDEKLNKAVERQLLSDVPVGFFLSGGVDSSLLVAIAKRISSKQLQCFTIDSELSASGEGFEDDLHYAKRVAKHLDVKLEVVKADIDIIRDFDFMIWHLDEPQADPAPLNVSNISKRAAEMGYKVLVGGVAGDDLFSGYRRHQAIRLEKYLSFVPAFLLAILSNVQLPSKDAFSRRLNKVVKELGKEPVERLSNYFVWLPKERLDGLFKLNSKESSHSSTDYLRNLLSEIPDECSWLNRMLFWEMRSFLVDHNLNYTDKMGMAHGVEIRVPFLDLELVEFATKLPPGLKLKGSETKYILKKVAERYLPNEVVYRSKTGFGAPVRKWILHDLDHVIRTRLLTESKYNAIFNVEELRRLVDENKAGRIDASYSIWGLLAVESWIRQFIFRERWNHR